MNWHPKKGLFVVFEGIDGAGKSYLLQLVAKRLSNHYPPKQVITTREPGGTDFGEQIRKQLLSFPHSLNPKTLTLLFAAMRSEHVEKVIYPALAAKKLVITDRYWFSSYVYQGKELPSSLRMIADLNQWATINLQPNLIFYFQVNKTTYFQRLNLKKQQSNNFNHWDKQQSFPVINHLYEQLFSSLQNHPNTLVVKVDGNEEVGVMVEQISQIIINNYR